jgi:hypothetical protein
MKAKRVARTFFPSAALLLLGACSADLDRDEAPSDDPPASGQVEGLTSIVAELPVTDTTTVFIHSVLDGEGHEYLSLSEKSNGGTPSVIDAINADQPHTLLEVYSALARDARAPAVLLDEHPKQAKALGRSDVGVRVPSLDFDRFHLRNKAISCNDWAFPIGNGVGSYNPRRVKNPASGDYWLSGGANGGGFNPVNDWNYSTIAGVTLAICNTGNPKVKGQIGFDRNDDAQGWIYWGLTPDLNFNDKWRWEQLWFVWGSTWMGLPVIHGCRYAVHGVGPSNSTYILTYGEIVPQ